MIIYTLLVMSITVGAGFHPRFSSLERLSHNISRFSSLEKALSQYQQIFEPGKALPRYQQIFEPGKALPHLWLLGLG